MSIWDYLKLEGYPELDNMPFDKPRKPTRPLVVRCPDCYGYGTLELQGGPDCCDKCHGKGYIPSDKLIEVTMSVNTFAGLNVRQATAESPAGISMAIYGAPGVGKTTLAAQASLCEWGGRTLVLDAEGGTRSITHLPNVDVIDVTDWQTLGKITNELANPNVEVPWGTIILDNMSEYQAINMKSIAGKEVPQLQHWMKNTNDMLYVTRLYRDLARSRGFNVFYIAWEAPEKDETGITKRDVGFSPSLARQFPGIIDMVAYLTVENDPPTYTRVISFAPSPRTAAKFRRSRTEIAKDIPLTLYYTQDETPMVELLATLKGGVPWPAGKYARRQATQTQTQR